MGILYKDSYVVRDLGLDGKHAFVDEYGAFSYCSNLSHITSLNPEPPECISDAFDGVDYNTCLLSVPVGTKEAYASADVWKEFYNIEDTEDTNIDAVSTDTQDKTVSGYYTIDGKQISVPTKGINIIKYSNGTSKKIMVK